MLCNIIQKKARKELKDVNIVQVKLLSFVDINELFKIPQSYSTYEVRAQKILELFGFDFNKLRKVSNEEILNGILKNKHYFAIDGEYLIRE